MRRRRFVFFSLCILRKRDKKTKKKEKCHESERNVENDVEIQFNQIQSDVSA